MFMIICSFLPGILNLTLCLNSLSKQRMIPLFPHLQSPPQPPPPPIGMGRRGGEVRRWGEREIIYLSLHCHHQNDFCIKMGSDESHFNVSVGSDGQSHKMASTNHNFF